MALIWSISCSLATSISVLPWKDQAIDPETSIKKVLGGNYTVNVYKNKSSKDADPNSNIVCSTYGTYVPKHTASAKNDFAQAYIALKATDACKDLADA